MISKKQEIFLKDILSKMEYCTHTLDKENNTLIIQSYIPSFFESLQEKLLLIKRNAQIKIEFSFNRKLLNEESRLLKKLTK